MNKDVGINGLIKARMLLKQCLSQFNNEQENVVKTLYNVYPEEMNAIEKLITSIQKQISVEWQYSDNDKIFKFFADEHNLILTDGELDDIIHVLQPKKSN